MEETTLPNLESYGTQPDMGPLGTIIMLGYVVVIVLVVAGMWKMFSKAGEPGWAAIIPIYNVIVYMKIAGKPIWWFILMFIPCVGIVFWIIASMGVAKNFGKPEGWGIGMGLLPFIFLPILGFSDAKFIGQKTA